MSLYSLRKDSLWIKKKHMNAILQDILVKLSSFTFAKSNQRLLLTQKTCSLKSQ